MTEKPKVLMEHCHIVSLSVLRKFGYLRKKATIKGSLQWTRGGEVVSSIDVSSNMAINPPTITLSYSVSGTRINGRHSYSDKHFLVEQPSNLGFGHRYYFYCHGTRCLNLYSSPIDGRFRPRHFFKMHYQSQMESKDSLCFSEIRRIGVELDKINSRRYVKTFYGNKETPIGSKLNRLITEQYHLAHKAKKLLENL